MQLGLLNVLESCRKSLKMDFKEKGIIEQLIELGLINFADNKMYIGKKENIPVPPTKANKDIK